MVYIKNNTRRKARKANTPREETSWTYTSRTNVPIETVHIKGLSESQMETLITLTKQATELKAQTDNTWTDELLDLYAPIMQVVFSSTTFMAPDTPTQ
jgi:hypothetical protein